ncbi:ABC transporter [Brevibacterium moorei]|uniref:ABC transporter n=1 Tax=Brevibacterium moorei TaxID=2968457 RepID=UPI00211B8996|nr:ABC transporter [Brevibacterium sp. 68QC2CO]MCQ9386658.1 ABC transporter [Brevibacterium sp. 68QC2CO]
MTTSQPAQNSQTPQAHSGTPVPPANGGLDLCGLRVGGASLDVRPEPLAPGESLVLAGDPDNVADVLAGLRARIGAGSAADATVSPAEGRGTSANRLLAGGPRVRLARAVARLVDPRSAAFARAGRHFALDYPALRRTRVGELGPEQLGRAQLACEFAHALAHGRAQACVHEPFMGLSGGARAGLRANALAAVADFGIGLITATNNRIDAALMAPNAAMVEKDQLADYGPLGEQIAAPRSNLAASIAGVNVFSGLARSGWISIGHSQVRAKTELDGKLFVTIPTSAAVLSLDEYDPAFDAEVVFEALVTGIRDSGDRVQVTLSPSDTEVGLVMAADLFDFRGATAPGHEWGLVHPGLGASVAAQRAAIHVGTRLWVQVRTAELRAYPVDAAPTVIQN